MEIKTRRWNDPIEPDDGYRLLVTRYRPRGVKRDGEPWDNFWPHLGPSIELHAAAYGKGVPAIAWEEYRARYLVEMRAQTRWIASLAESVGRGEPLTLLCSSACPDAAQCHRSLLRALILDAARPRAAMAPGRVVRREPPVPR